MIRLTDITISEHRLAGYYVGESVSMYSLPAHFFSDLFRVALLSTYGGVWLDATYLPLEVFRLSMEKTDFFMYQL